jgi:hypothetical protein
VVEAPKEASRYKVIRLRAVDKVATMMNMDSTCSLMEVSMTQKEDSLIPQAMMKLAVIMKALSTFLDRPTKRQHLNRCRR